MRGRNRGEMRLIGWALLVACAGSEPVAKSDALEMGESSTAAFARPLVSVTFDDGFASAAQRALPILRRHGVVATHYVLTGRIGQADRLSQDMVKDLAAAGHEIAAHTVTHRDLTVLPPAVRRMELTSAKAFLEALGVGPVRDFASPFGAYDRATLTDIMGVYASHRTTEVGYNSRVNFDARRIKAQSVKSTTALSEVERLATRAALDRAWLVLVYHDIQDAPAGPYDVTAESLDRHLAILAKHGLRFVTVRQALDELVPQRGRGR